MAEKQLAYRVSGKEEFFAEDDPLAELARIVGFDPRPAAPVAANQRQEPAFDLEDELLREFERYDAPRAAPDAVAQQQAAVQQHFADEAPAPAYHQPVEEPVIQPDAHQAAWQDAEPAYESPQADWTAAEENWELPHHAEPAHVPAAQQHYAPELTVFEPPSIETRDLSDELEMSIGDASVAPPSSKTPQWAAASIRLPLANFNTQQRREPPAPAVEAAPVEPAFDVAPPAPIADFEAPATLGFPAEQDRHEFHHSEPAFAAPESFEPAAPEFDLVAAAREGRVEADAALTQPAYAPAEADAAIDIDDLLADVSRYPVPAREPAARLEPSVPAPAAQVPVSRAEPPVALQAPAPEPVVEDIDPFEGHEFDLDLAEIELELAELDLAEADAEPEQLANEDWLNAAPTPAPAKAAPAPSPAPAPARAPEPVAAPIARAPEPAPVEIESYMGAEQELPFDPSEISETEDRIETFEDMHVPALPPVEEIEPVAPAPDYDFDIDAEMANLFSPPAAEAPPEQPAAVAAVAQAAAATGRVAAYQKPADGLDEFERALEEDFRRSFRETPLPNENASQMHFESTSMTADRWRARSMRGFAIAAAAVVIVGAGAYGVYGWMFHSGSTLGFTSGEPRVIVADTDPVKVVPDNPGGKVVPNQDKAVYDRVAGDSTQAPKQKELVTSDEQPVDVVQKTLIPEASPDDSEGDPNAGAPTPVGETEDPRLLPGQANTQVAAAQDEAPSVAPRKVRTMIVKPDGTLVPRDDDASAATGTQKPAPALATPTKPAPAASITQMAAANPAPANTDAASAESAPIRVVKTTNLDNAPATAGTPSPATPVPTVRPAQPAATAPAAAATAPAAPAKPVVAEKPVAAPKPAQVASATPAPQPPKAAADTSAASGGYGMQIASLPSEDEAKRSQASLSAKFGSVLGGHPMEVRKVDIPGKGTYYRVRVPVGSKDDAAALCVKLRAAGGTCLISK